ncbi:MAG: DEAD/DEAH box helicase [Bacteroidales bacterium]|nr:DEAD/DEAH box helicase [Bacteroidales bacterium]
MTKNQELAVIIAERIAFGYVFTPCITETKKGSLIEVVETITPTYLETRQDEFDEATKAWLTMLFDISEQRLFQRFSKQSTLKRFYSTLTTEAAENEILPFIDKIHCKALPFIIERGIPMYLRKSGYSSLFADDRIHVSKYPSRPKFYFTLTQNNELSYKLKINEDGEEFELYGKKCITLSDSPAILLFGRYMFYFTNIDSKKFKPFLSKKRIIVPATSLEKYMGTFVRTCIANYFVSAYGFSIKKKDIDCQPILTIENSVFGYNFALYFKYGDRRHAYNEMQKIVELTKDDDGRYVFMTSNRQKAKEDTLMERLNEVGLTPIGNALLSCDVIGNAPTPTPLIEWINTNYDYLAQCGIEIEDSQQGKYYIGHTDLRMNITENIDWFDIYGTVVLDGVEIPFISLRDNIVDKNPEYVLPNGKTLVIPQEWLTMWSDIMTFAKAEKGRLVLSRVHATLLPSATGDDIDTETKLKLSTTPRRGRIDATLRPYQSDGFTWLNTLYENRMGGILADDMGLGKTLQTITLLAHVYTPDVATESDDLPSLIVVPTSLIHNWLSEIKRFSPDLRAGVFEGSAKQTVGEINKLFGTNNIVLASYGHVRIDIDTILDRRFKYLIIDESQYIKNPASKTYQAVKKITAEHRLTLTGTPIENSLNDLWAQMNIVNPKLLGTSAVFKNYFETPITKFNDTQREEKLKKIIAPYILRRTKEMVEKDLPPVSYQTINCLMTDDQRAMYERVKTSIRNELIAGGKKDEKDKGKTALMFLAALMRLRLIANHPALVDKDYTGDSGKFGQVIDNIQNVANEGHKMLVFSSFVRDLELIAGALEAHGIGYSMLTGSTANRKEVIDDFASSDKKVFLISLKAGGVGLNLTCADYVFMLNPWWNPAAESQAISRAHRIGQTNHVFVYRFITTESIEEKIQRLQQSKLALAENFIKNNNPLKELTDNEIENLFE